MASWITYIQERFPIPSYLILSLGFAISGAMLSGDSWSWYIPVIGTLGLMLFFAELRLMDEFKDFAKDKIAHPDRPLPRKLLDVAQVESVIFYLFFLMIGFGGVTALVLNPISGGYYLAFTLYLWLMYKEFYIGEKLAQSPILYAFTHQIIIIPICFFCIALAYGQVDLGTDSLAYSIAVLGAFFSYEICRKLDPNANPILKTYLSVYGPIKTWFFVFALTGLSGYAAPYFEAQTFLWPLELIVILTLSFTVLKPSQFKLAEGIATLSLICHIWALPARLLLRKFL